MTHHDDTQALDLARSLVAAYEALMDSLPANSVQKVHVEGYIMHAASLARGIIARHDTP